MAEIAISVHVTNFRLLEHLFITFSTAVEFCSSAFAEFLDILEMKGIVGIGDFVKALVVLESLYK